MENGYEKVGAWIGVPLAFVIIGALALHDFIVYVLPWLLLVAAVIGGIWFFFWQRTTKRSAHPWD